MATYVSCRVPRKKGLVYRKKVSAAKINILCSSKLTKIKTGQTSGIRTHGNLREEGHGKLQEHKSRPIILSKDAENSIKKSRQTSETRTGQTSETRAGQILETWTGQTPRKKIEQREQTLGTTTRQTFQKRGTGKLWRSQGKLCKILNGKLSH